MCAEPQAECKRSSFHVPIHVLIAPDIEASFITVPLFGFCEVNFHNSAKFIQLYSSKDGISDGSVVMVTS